MITHSWQARWALPNLEDLEDSPNLQYLSISPDIDHTQKSSAQRGTMSPRFTTQNGQELANTAIPSSYQVLVTTSRGVYSWASSGICEVFRSGSGGIVGAKKLSGDGDLLAVADSQVVVLHNVKAGMQQSYRLKGTDVSMKTALCIYHSSLTKL